MNINQVIVLLFMLILLASCKKESVSISQDEIIANWNIISAERNGVATSTLENAYIRIGANEIEHNLNGEQVTSPYQYEKNNLAMQDELIQNMEVVSLTNDTLKTKTKINKFEFDFILVKNEDE